MTQLSTLLAQAPLFRDLEAHDRQVVEGLMRPVSFRKGDLLFRQGAPGDGLYVLEAGEVEAYIRLPGDSEVPLGRLGPADVFGEMALAAPQQGRSASARATTEASAYFLDERAFAGLCAHLHPSSFTVLRQLGLLLCDRLRKRYETLAGDRLPPATPATAEQPEGRPVVAADLVIAHILPCFQRLNPTEIGELSSHLVRIDVPRGHVLFRDGDPATACYFVLRGAVELSVRRADRPLRLAVLGPGQAVGQAELFYDAPHSLVAAVRENAILARLSRAAMNEVLERKNSLALRLLEHFNVAVVAAIRRTDMALAHTNSAFAAGS